MFGGLLDSFKPGAPKFVITGVLDTRTHHTHAYFDRNASSTSF